MNRKAASSFKPAQTIGAMAAAGAAIVHAAVSGNHWDVWWGYGAMFIGFAAIQFISSACLAVSRNRLLLAGVLLGNLTAIAAWILTRTAGHLIGPSSGVVEPVDYPGVLTVTLEAITVLATCWLLARPGPPSWSRTYHAVVASVAAVMVVAVTSGAVVTGLHGHHGPGGHGTAHHHDGPADGGRRPAPVVDLNIPTTPDPTSPTNSEELEPPTGSELPDGSAAIHENDHSH